MSSASFVSDGGAGDVVPTDGGRQAPQVSDDLFLFGRQPERVQVRAEGADQILHLVLDQMGRFARDGQLLRQGVREREQLPLHLDRLFPAAGLTRETQDLLARVGVLGRDGEAAQYLVEGAGGVAHFSFAQVGPQSEKLDPLARFRAGPRDAGVHVEQPTPVLCLPRDSFQIGEELPPGRIDRQRVGEDPERPGRVSHLLLADERDLQGGRQLLERLRRPVACPLVNLNELLVQTMSVRCLVHRLEGLGVGVLQVGPSIPLEPSARIAEVLFVQARDLEDEDAALVCVVRLLEQLLVGVGEPLVVAGLLVERRHRLQRLEIFRVHLQHALEDGNGALVVLQPVAHERAQFQRLGNAQRRIVDQVQLPLGNLDDPRPVFVALVVGAQAGMGLEVARIELRDEPLEGLRGGVDVVQLLVEDSRAL